MNLTPGQTHEAYLGPSSGPIDIAAFLSAGHPGNTPEEIGTSGAPSQARGLQLSAREEWSTLDAAQQEAVQSECCVDDLRALLNDTMSNPRLMNHVTRTHDAFVQAIYETAEPTRRKRKRATFADPEDELPEVRALRLKHEAIALKCWPLTIHAASFIRPSKQSDHNTLVNVKTIGSGPTSEGQRDDALLFVTVYNRLSWGQKFLSRASQHVVLSSQTIGDFYEAIPCSSNERPLEVHDDSGDIIGYKSRQSDDMATDASTSGAMVCIENVLYGDGQDEHDYADKAMQLVQTLPENSRPHVSLGASMHDVKFASLTMRLHEPYWIVHAGKCEHWFIVSSIRLRHPSDPRSGYPLTTQITPALSEICRVCTKVPALFSVVGDMRFGESPFLICGPCWRWMGEPKDGSEVLVVPVPVHELGWSNTT
ncbi:snRNA-activating protein of 50kDa MW C terminal-domain-containing protein [Epithele typhae]|uniref:snRNA-activating protein of 50kDa MW C terminal-domain-containing protein n=1 Tax=Epithele typhae TaxID=378194 RepID=UPI002007754D|nr:snRNA-activating protein of 50kDa MW C terminal-domain-containing protein [Epithele typhae]KAH9931093.1 snRNA-activating protein of 50kDa MW C terminal-domain-containing protein [Epithele typhae]